MTDLPLHVTPGSHGIGRTIATQLRQAIHRGHLATGTRLPSTRELAYDLGVSRGVVVEAYEQLVAEGFLLSQRGSGTTVARLPGHPPSAAARPASKPPPARFNLRVGTPDLAAFPRRQWLAATRDVLNTLPNTALDYPDPGGHPQLRGTLADYTARVRAAVGHSDNIVIVSGVAHGLALLTRALGHIRLAIEDPTSMFQLPLLRGAGAQLIPVPVDREGMDMAALRATDANAVLLTPAHQYPTGVVLSAARRAQLREWAAERDAFVIEDDYDAEFRYDREPVGCLQGLLPERTVLLGTVSKTLAPALRLGWMLAPPRLATAVRESRAHTDLGSATIEQLVLAHLISNGDYDRHVRAMRQHYRQRRDALVTALRHRFPGADIAGISAGQHLYVEMPGANEAEWVSRARKYDVDVQPAGDFRVATAGPAGFVLGFSRLTPQAITEAVRRLALAWS